MKQNQIQYKITRVPRLSNVKIILYVFIGNKEHRKRRVWDKRPLG